MVGSPQEVLARFASGCSSRPGAVEAVGRRLCPALAKEGIVIGSVEDLSKGRLERARAAIRARGVPRATPLGVGPGQPFPFISPLSLSLGVFVRDPKTEEERFARLKVPKAFLGSSV